MKDRVDAILRQPQALYLESLLNPREALLTEMERFAQEYGHPIADPEVAQMMRMLVRLHRPIRILEVGTNIGYSVVVMGRECGDAARIETIEINRPTLDIARDFVARAELPCEVIFHEGAALEVIPGLAGFFDFVFIDCVKTEYADYLDALMPKLRDGALIICDNLLWKGQVAEEVRVPGDEQSTAALREFNGRIMNDRRLVSIVLPLGDGLGISIVQGNGRAIRLSKRERGMSDGLF